MNGVMKVTEGEEAADVLNPPSSQPNIEERKLAYLQKFIDDCKVNNIKLMMVYSPYYGQTIPSSILMIEQLAEKNGITFMNYGDHARFQKPEFFKDASHLNDTGAREFSKEVAYKIKSHIN